MWFGPLSLTQTKEHTCAKLQHIHELAASSCPHQTRVQTYEQGPKNKAIQKVNYGVEWSGVE